MEKACECCGKRFKAPTMGRPKRFCSTRCRVMASRRRRSTPIPLVLVASDRWLCWKPILRRGRWTKMPVQVNGRAASSTDPETWTDFKAVSSRDRIGYVLGGRVDGKLVVCVDLDHCFTADGSLTAGATDFLKGFPATWCEVSPSGDGLHVWGLVDERPNRCVFTHKDQSVEVYVDGRYVTITSSPFNNAPLVLADLSEAIGRMVPRK